MVRRFGGPAVALWAAAVLGAMLWAAPTAPVQATAASADPAAQQIDSFDGQLLDVMRQARALGVNGRYHRLLPVVEHAYDIPTMIRFAVGPGWATIPPAQQEALTDAFARLTAASYAHNFTGYSGERFDTDANVLTRGPDKVVTTHIRSGSAAPVSIAYRMRQASDGAWKIIDVFYNGSISQLTTKRADFASSLAHGGAPALLAHLNALVDSQLK